MKFEDVNVFTNDAIGFPSSIKKLKGKEIPGFIPLKT
jgi:hypothetical protein